MRNAEATRDAGKLASLDVLRIINEPTAASLAYGFVSNNESAKLRRSPSYDLGSGTHISVLRIVGGVFDVLSTNGDAHLGGDDFDRAIVNHWIRQSGITRKNWAPINRCLNPSPDSGKPKKLSSVDAMKQTSTATYSGCGRNWNSY